MVSTDMGGLDPDKTKGAVRRWFITFVVFTGLIGGGFALGAWLTGQQYRDDIQQLNRDHVAEIERLQAAYGRSLGDTASATADAAKKAEAAANAVEAAATKQLQLTAKPQPPAKEPAK